MVLNSLPCVLVSLCLVFFSSSPCKARIYTNHWAVRIAGGPEQADHIASKYGYRNLGQIGDLKDYYHFFHSRTIKRSTLFSRGTHSFISMEPKVEWVQQQVVKRRTKRDYKPSYPGPVQYSMVQPSSIYFNDAKWTSMWYIHCNDNIHNCQSDMNIVGAWKRGYTGKDVVVTILDDGIERNHPDLIQNYDNEASYDVNGNDMDPMPRYDASNENKHGTRCAGEVAASANNSHCTVGIAYNAKIGGVRMLDGDVTDMVEAKSLSLHPQHIDIYSASWGPDDDGKTVDGPASLARQAFENGIRLGRKGRGSIFVWASGNGGRSRDHCSCDGYTNSIYTISISSTAESGRKPWYLEECASTLTTTYSSGENYDRKIITTDLRQRCTDSHTGTSASAPMAAGIIALALEANPFLTWRDIQHIIVKTSRAGHLSAPDWKTNAAGYNVSHLYGFGLMDAEAMVKEAERWKQVPPQHICVENADKQIRTIRPEHVVRSVYKATGCTDNANNHVIYLEHVVVRITITHPRRGDLSINLTSPSGTKSQLLANRLFDHSMEGFKNWEFMTTHCWGEKAAGDWILEIYDSPSQLRSQKAPGKLKEWSLVLYGTSQHPYSFRSDKPRSLAEPQPDDEYSEEYVGSCHPECENGCEGPGPQQCITCLHYFLKFKNNTRMCVSECPTGFFRDDKKRCKKCSPLCESCMGSRSDQCSTCRLGLYLVEGGNSCASSCPDGFYLDLESTILQGNKCQLSCEPGTYYNGHRRACEKCHLTCATCCLHLNSFDSACRCDPTCYVCAGPGERNCSTCLSGYNLENGMCIVSTICKDGEYLSKAEKCVLCSSTCSKCTGPGSKDCISCPHTRLFDNGTCVIHCDPGKYERDGQCHLCHHTCLECTDGAPDKCTRCSKDRFGVERYLFEGQCRESCPKGYSHSSKGTCDPCPPNCTVCTSSGHCVHCTPSYYPKDGTCAKLECGVGEVVDFDHEDCVPCEEGCQHCLTEMVYFCRLKSSCHKICPERTFEDRSTMRCARCDDHCESCDASECYLCEDGFFLSDGTCVETCKEGFYADMKQECEPCHRTCRSCGGPGEDQCDSCQKGDMHVHQRCVSVCPRETHGNQTSGRCEDCSAGCLTCQDAHHCVKCKESFGPLYLQDGKCVAGCKRGYPEADVCYSCAVGCASCEEKADFCLSCEEDYVRFKHSCVLQCPSRHFIKDGVCEICPNGCAECDQMHKCTCEEYYFLHEDQCVGDCPKGYFTNREQKLCTLCHSDCAECDGPDEDDCTSCGHYRDVRHNGKCLIQCPYNTYSPSFIAVLPQIGRIVLDILLTSNMSVFLECDKSCLTCSGPHPSSCLTCRADQTCVSTCPDGYYVDEDKQECVQCHVNCASCHGHHSQDCTTCKPGLLLLGHSCFTTCPPRYYFVNATSRACQECDHTCEECSGSSRFCLKCRNGYFLLRKSGQCLRTCPPNYFLHTLDGDCQRCHPTCKTCSGAISCTSCYDGFEMFGGICSSMCLFGEYPIVENKSCVTCDPSCYECKGPGPYSCISCPVLQRLTEDGRCLPCCGEKTHRDSRFPSECCQCHALSGTSFKIIHSFYTDFFFFFFLQFSMRQFSLRNCTKK
uniref:Proprotein convertase subtilisin/kexin type 5b n=1 Tax=Cyprinus carpio TaxID=7962 RepID=A0A8C1MNG8_CYPCA